MFSAFRKREIKWAVKKKVSCENPAITILESQRHLSISNGYWIKERKTPQG